MTDSGSEPVAACVFVRCVPGTTDFRVVRGSRIPSDFWLAVVAHWGSAGGDAASRIVVSRDAMLRDLGWLGPACRSFGVAIDWDGSAQEALRALRDERQAVADALVDPGSVRADDLARLLEASRHRGGLKPFQVRDLARLLHLWHGANFSVPGAGKTAVTYALYEVERVRNRVNQLLVVAPISAFQSWVDEAVMWLDPTPSIAVFDGRAVPADVEVLVTNYQRAVSSLQELSSWAASGRTHVVLDEAHRVKRGWSGQWGSACLGLAFTAARRDVLTGTPAPNHPRDLVALMEFCWPGQGDALLPDAALRQRPDSEAVAAAGDAIRPLFVRTTKAELDLPPVRFNVRTLQPGTLQREIYQALRSRYRGEFAASESDRGHFMRLGRAVMYLLEAAVNPALLPVGSSDDDPLSLRHPPLHVPPGSALADLIGRYGDYETPPKFVELAALLRENAEAGRKTLVWSNFVRNLDLLANETLVALQPALIHGGIPYETEVGPSRLSELARFRTDPDCWVLLANPAALGEGASLHDVCHDAVYMDRTFNAGQYLQSLDRIHRLGLRSREVTRISVLLTDGTIDEVVGSRLAEKVQVLERLMSDQHLSELSLPDEDDNQLPMQLDVPDIEALLSHLRSAS